MGYGLPLGLDSRQAGIGALVTVATLKTSEGGGKTQTQCLFLRTEKGNCLYSKARPGSGLASNVVGGWLRGKTGGGGRDTAAGRRDNGPTLPAQTGANRVRMRSGRRWRKSGNAAERTGLKQQRSREEAAGEITLEEWQEERDKGGFPTYSLDSKLSPPQQDNRRARQEKEGPRSPRCCHNTSAKPCARCGRRTQRQGDQEDHKGGESPRSISHRLNNEEKEMRKERHKKVEDEEEEEKSGLSGFEPPDSLLVVPNPEPESDRIYPEFHSGCEAGEMKEAESNETLKKQTSNKDGHSLKEDDTNSQTEVIKTHTGSDDFINSLFVMTDNFTSRHIRDFDGRKTDTKSTTCIEQTEENKTGATVNGFSGHVTPDQEPEQEMFERLSDEEEEGSVNLTPDQISLKSICVEEASIHLSAFPASVSASASPLKTHEPSSPLEGSTYTAEHESHGVHGKQESSRKVSEHKSSEEHLGRCQQREGEALIVDEEELHDNICELQMMVVSEKEPVSEEVLIKKDEEDGLLQERNTSSSSFPPLRQVDDHGDALIFERILTENNGNFSRTEPNAATEDEQRDEMARKSTAEENLAVLEGVKPEERGEVEEIWREEQTCKGTGDDNEDWYTNDGAKNELYCEKSDKDIKRNWMSKEDWRLQEPAEEFESGRKCISCQPAPLEEERGIEGGWNEEICRESTTNAAHVSYVEENSPLSPFQATTITNSVAMNYGALPQANPAPPLPTLGAMATSLEVEGVREVAREGDGSREGKRRQGRELRSPEEQGEEERGSTVATERGRKDEEVEDEFGVFMQAEGEPVWSEGLAMTVPCGSRERIALENHTAARESTHWTSGWTDSSFHQSEDSWTAFPQQSLDEGGDTVGQWWPTSAVEERRDRLSANQTLAAVFSEAFPSLPGLSCDPDTVSTLTQLLRGNQHHSRASQDQGLLDSFHNLNKMIGQRYKRANSMSRDLLLQTLHLEHAGTENRTVTWTANQHLSPGLPSANQHAQNAAAKRRLSYDYNRNVMD
ncbi:hypothetical protein LDENG_00106950 [Lucifuga dentata]|nr:hypothetical protein LDENG_00106950 [Lucifuga dentata]